MSNVLVSRRPRQDRQIERLSIFEIAATRRSIPNRITGDWLICRKIASFSFKTLSMRANKGEIKSMATVLFLYRGKDFTARVSVGQAS
jgi:hypothetical protein